MRQGIHPRIAAMVLASACLHTHAADAWLETSGQRVVFDSYYMCATLRLPDDFRTIRDADAAAATAAGKCRTELLAMAGQFALDNPGTRLTGKFLEIQRKRVVLALRLWVEASAAGAAPHLPVPVRQSLLPTQASPADRGVPGAPAGDRPRPVRVQ